MAVSKALLLLAIGLLLVAQPTLVLSQQGALPTEAEIKGLFDQWNAALKTLNPEAVADMYAADGVLLPTVSNQVRNTRAEIVDYFTDFLQKKPQGTIDESYVKILSPILAAHYGVYTFDLTDKATGVVSKVQARFSYTYRKEGEKWLIVEHHSSQMPEQKLPTEAEIKALFDQWNAALKTLDPEKVADMYAPNGVLLPTVSNKVRDTRAEIVDYFTDFLQKKPQGTIDESYVKIISPTSAAHYGIYTFDLTDKATGVVNKVQARFSYTYTKVGDKWLILEHHSSQMPEPTSGASSDRAARGEETPTLRSASPDAAAAGAGTSDDEAATQRIVYGVGLGVGLGVGAICIAMLAYLITITKVNRLQLEPVGATVNLDAAGPHKV